MPDGRRPAPVLIHVVVPAHDEADLLPDCLAGLRRARALLAATHPDLSVRTTVVLDRCADGSAAVVAADPDVEALVVAAGSVGAARRAGVARAAASAADLGPDRVWVASTDADSVVPEHWLVGQVALARRGYDLVTGTVHPDPADLPAAVLTAWRERHHLHDGHGHVHGANLGLTLAAYLDAGGFPDVPVGEDVHLVEAVQRTGRRWHASASLDVRTSGRVDSRTGAGFAGYLAALGAELDAG